MSENTVTAEIDPRLTYVNGRFRWLFADGASVPVVHGGADAAPTEVPADLAEMDDDALAALTDSLTSEFDGMIDDGSRDVARLTALADDIDRLRGERVARDTAAEAADQAIAQLAARVSGGAETPEADPEATPDPEAAAETEPEREPVTAAGRPALRDLGARARRPRPEARPATPAVTITAAGDLPGVRPGASIDLLQVAQSFHDRTRNLAMGQKASVARVQVPHTHTVGVDPMANLTAIESLVGQPEAAALVASGGWCAPSQTIFDLFDIGPDLDNIFDLPTLGSGIRSGVLLPSFYTIDDGSDALWTWTESDDIAAANPTTIASGAVASNVFTVNTADDHGLSVGSPVVISGTGVANLDGSYLVYSVTDADTFVIHTVSVANTASVTVGSVNAEKPCLRVPCPTFTEYVMEAEGLCVTHGNLSDRAWPELTRQFLSIVMGAHARRLSAAKIAKVLADSATVTPGAGLLVSDAVGDLLNVLALAAADLRSQYRVGKKRSVDALLPDWTLEVLRANMAMRAGIRAEDVADAEITRWLTNRGIRPQFTPDWQPLYRSGAASTDWPDNITFLIWFTGSYVALEGDEIDLGVTRDSTLNKTNDFTAAWSEQFYQVCRRGPQARQYTLAIGIDGKTGGPAS